LRLDHLLLLLHLLFIGPLQDASHQLLAVQVFGDAAIGASHFTQGQILITVFLRSTLLKTGRSNLIKEIRVHFHFRLGWMRV
jgi:hypothetical protein